VARRAFHIALTSLAVAMACASALGGAPAAHGKAPSPAPLVVIDPGHGGRYSNANANRLREKNVNLAIAKELRTALIARGYRVKMTRTTDRAVVYGDIRTWNYSASKNRWAYSEDGRRGLVGGIPKDDLQGRVNVANAAGADLFISIHGNGSVRRSSRGTEVWNSRRDKLGSSLAPYVQRSVVKATKLRNRGTHKADFYVCRWSNMPGILVETAFISSPKDARLLKKAWFRRRLARGIADGVDAWMSTKPYSQKYARVAASAPGELAVAASKAQFTAGADSAVLVRADRVAEVPGAAGLAARLGAPLLYVDSTGPNAATAAELARLGPERVVLAGVDGSLDSSAVASVAAASQLPTQAVEVIAGSDAADLSASIAASMGPAPSGTVLVASAADVYSTLPAAPLSASHGVPLLLTRGGTLSPQAQAWLNANRSAIENVILVGGSAGVPSSVASGFPVTRIDGVSYTQRAARLNSCFFGTGAVGSRRPVVATLLNHSEYLVAARHAGFRRQPLVPVSNRMLPSFTREWITNRRGAIAGFEIVTCGSIPYLMDHMLAKADYL